MKDNISLNGSFISINFSTTLPILLIGKVFMRIDKDETPVAQQLLNSLQSR